MWTRRRSARRIWLCGFGLVACLALVFATVTARAKKPPKPPGEGGITNPALTFHAGSKVYIMTADGSQSETLIGGGKTARREPTWLPDGSRVAFQLDKELFTIRIDGTDLTYVGPVHYEYSYLTEQVVLRERWGELEVVDLSTGATQGLGILDTLPAVEGAITPAATPDLDPDTAGYQGWIAYANNVRDPTTWPWPEINMDLHIVKLTGGSTVSSFAIDTSTITRLELPEPQKWPEWSADGGTIVYQGKSAGYYDGHKLSVVSVDLAGPSFGTPNVIHNPQGGTVYARPAVSPDGAWIAFWHRIYGGKAEIELIKADGTGWKVLTTKINLPGAPHWNPFWTNDLD
jgi:hypothetical protein